VQAWSYARRLDEIVGRLGPRFAPDVILATWAYPDLHAAVRVGRRRRLPVVGKVHGSDLNLLPAIGLEGQVRAALAAADRVVAVGEALRCRAIALGTLPERTVVVPNGIDVERFAPRDRCAARAALDLPLEGELLLYVGRLTPEKGPDLLLDAFAGLVARRPAAQLAIVGSGVLEPALRRRVGALGIGHRCRFVGQRSRADVARWLNAATLLVLPSRAEGVPNVLLEAVASGTPVVATRVGGVAEALEEDAAGLLVPPGDPPALAHAIGAALDRAFAPHAVRATLRAPSWDASARRMLDALEEGVRAHAARTEPRR
jgi:glycosyltransferase involved in cell wall biosynthesis